MDKPITRLVTMTFMEGRANEFLKLFDEASPQIRGFQGCLHLSLLQAADAPTVFTTYSLWDSAASLEKYRSSPFFDATWKKTKSMFAAPPTARSYYKVRVCDDPPRL